MSFLEKYTTSEFKNSTGAYELDLSLVDDFDHAWREMHVKTDVWCSAAIVLPDKAARILNVGGWLANSTIGIRLYTPDGSPGINGTNDWEEDQDNLQLQVRWCIHSCSTCKVSMLNEFAVQGGRWYSTAVVMSNGSILIMGGVAGAGGVADPTVEILPRIPGGSTKVSLDFLQRTSPNNLYPFVNILPSGRIFVGEFERTDFFTFIIDAHGQGITTRHVFLTQYHLTPSKSFPTSLVLSRVPPLVAHTRMKPRRFSFPNMLPTRTQSLSWSVVAPTLGLPWIIAYPYNLILTMQRGRSNGWFVYFFLVSSKSQY